MPKFDRYLLSQLLVLFGFFALVLVSVYWLNQAVRLFDQLIGDGQSALVFLQFSALSLPNVIRLVLPVAGFAATVYGVNRLLSESELVVVQAMGFSAIRLARPMVVFGLFITVLVLILNHFVVPLSRAQLAEQRAEISRNVTSKLLSEGSFLHPSTGVTFFIREITSQGELRDVFLSDARSKTSRTTYTAQGAVLIDGDDGPKLLMFEGMAQTLRLSDQRLSVTHFSDSVLDIGSLIRESATRQPALEELATAVLLSAEPELQFALGKSKAEILHEGHSRTAKPFLALVGVLLGFSTLMLGAFSRFGVWRQIILAISLVIATNVFYNMMVELALQSPLYWPALYLPSLLGCALALLLIWLADNPHMLRRFSRRGAET